MGIRPPFFHRQLQTFASWVFSVYHDIRVEGAGHVPPSGPAIIAANHPTYLDAAFLMVGIGRSVRFMAWEKPFRLPLLGHLMRAYGSIPVDMKKPGRGSFEAAIRVLRNGEVFGIFPEGGRTKGLTPMNPLKSGVARLALITGAPIIPATILGGRRVWRKGDLLPKPGPIRVVFHSPLVLDGRERTVWRRDKEVERRLLGTLIETIHKNLLPHARMERRKDRLFKRRPQAPNPFVEGIPVLYLAACWASLGAEAWRPAVPWIIGYLLLLIVERVLWARGRFVKWLRVMLPWITLAGIIHTGFGFPGPWALAGEAAAGGLIVWLTIFRFNLYRRARSLLLSVAYGTWLLQVLSLYR